MRGGKRPLKKESNKEKIAGKGEEISSVAPDRNRGRGADSMRMCEKERERLRKKG